jgi:hypothetical protein
MVFPAPKGRLKNDGAGDDEHHFSAIIGGANQSEFSTDAIRPFPHPSYSEMTVLRRFGDIWVDTTAVVPHSQNQVICVLDLHVHLERS